MVDKVVYLSFKERWRRLVVGEKGNNFVFEGGEFRR